MSQNKKYVDYIIKLYFFILTRFSERKILINKMIIHR